MDEPEQIKDDAHPTWKRRGRPRNPRKRPTKLRETLKYTKKRETALVNKLGKLREKKESLEKVTEAALEPDAPKVVTDKDLSHPSVSTLRDTAEVIFRPNPGPQTEFLAASEKEVFYGGARGGGKSYSLIVDPLRYCDKEAARALILRKTMPELRDLINHAQRLYPRAFPGAKWREQEKEWRFPSGARVEFGYAETRSDALRYQGQAYTWIGIDELPQYPDAGILNDLRGSLRSVDPSIPEFIRACVDEGEVLTLAGWKNIQDVRRGELVYSLNTKTQALELQAVTNIFRYDVDEDIARVRGKGMYMSMTKDHRIVHTTDRGGKINISRLYEIKNTRINVVRSISSYNTEGYKGETLGLTSEQYMYLLGLFLSEGCATTRKRINIAQTKEDSKTTIREFLKTTGWRWAEDKVGFTLSSSVHYSHFTQFGKSKDKFIPREVLETASEKELSLLLEALILGDGHRSKFDYIEYYSTSRQLIDDVMEIALKCGYKAYSSYKDRPLCSTQRQYMASIRKNYSYHTEVNQRENISYERYKGPVFCISVNKNENFILRQKGFAWFSGNTGNP